MIAGMKTLVPLPAVALVVLGCAANAEPPVWGVARAQDGDSLVVDGTRVRLFGIDAPELGQTCTRAGRSWDCGKAAAEELGKLVSGRRVMCLPSGVDRYGRLLGRCTVGTIDINRTMVESGYALAYRHYSSDYVTAEANARTRGSGLWTSQFELPSDYRHDGRADKRSASGPRVATVPRSGPARRPSGDCRIKGNRNRRGQWIYHLPGMRYYDQTRPEEIFCTEQDAQAAGYRRARDSKLSETVAP